MKEKNGEFMFETPEISGVEFKFAEGFLPTFWPVKK